MDTINWLSNQSFCESIGYWGDSYLAYTGWCMADCVPDKLKTMYLGVYGCDRHTSAYKDGLFRQDILTAWAMGNAGDKIDADYLQSCLYRPQIKVDENMWNVRLEWYRDWISHTDKSDAYWQDGLWGNLAHVPEKIKFPVFIKEGWYDHHLGSAMVTYDRLNPGSKAKSTLKIGPWNHGYRSALTHQKTDQLIDDQVESPLSWFTNILIKKQEPTSTIDFYMIGKDQWVQFDHYPLDLTKLDFYLNPLKILTENVEIQGEITYIYDPEKPTKSHGAESLFHTRSEVGSLIQPECDYREDVISFVSHPLKQAIDIVGKINVKLYVSSDCEDTAFTCKLMEEFEDGTTVNIRGTITTLAYRNNTQERLEYQPNEIVEINLEMWDIAWQLQQESKLRLDVSSSDFPQYAIHSNYAGVWSQQEKTRKAKQTIYMGEKYPSKIELPILK